MDNKVTLLSIQKKTSSDLGLIAKVSSIVIFMAFMLIVFTVKMSDLWKGHIFVITFITILLLNLAALLLGRFSKYFQKRSCLDWYAWDKNRITLFNDMKKAWQTKFETELDTAVEEMLKDDPRSREELKKMAIETIKKLLADTRKQQEEVLERLIANEELELLKIIQFKNNIDQMEEDMTEWLLDFISHLKRESENEELPRQRIRTLLINENIPALNERLAYYDELIASCEKSTSDLARMLKNRYNHVIS